jgi:hypothetical protein
MPATFLDVACRVSVKRSMGKCEDKSEFNALLLRSIHTLMSLSHLVDWARFAAHFVENGNVKKRADNISVKIAVEYH